MSGQSLSWGKPTINVAPHTAVGTVPTTGFVQEFIPVKDSTKLTPTAGAEKKAEVEGGGLEGYKREKNANVFEYEIRKVKGRTPNIEAFNGVVSSNYAVQLIPEDATVEGFFIENASVHVEDTWDAENGAKWKFTFTVLEAITADKQDVEWGVQTSKVTD